MKLRKFIIDENIINVLCSFEIPAWVARWGKPPCDMCVA